MGCCLGIWAMSADDCHGADTCGWKMSLDEVVHTRQKRKIGAKLLFKNWKLASGEQSKWSPAMACFSLSRARRTDSWVEEQVQGRVRAFMTLVLKIGFSWQNRLVLQFGQVMLESWCRFLVWLGSDKPLVCRNAVQPARSNSQSQYSCVMKCETLLIEESRFSAEQRGSLVTHSLHNWSSNKGVFVSSQILRFAILQIRLCDSTTPHHNRSSWRSPRLESMGEEDFSQAALARARIFGAKATNCSMQSLTSPRQCDASLTRLGIVRKLFVCHTCLLGVLPTVVCQSCGHQGNEFWSVCVLTDSVVLAVSCCVLRSSLANSTWSLSTIHSSTWTTWWVASAICWSQFALVATLQRNSRFVLLIPQGKWQCEM